MFEYIRTAELRKITDYHFRKKRVLEKFSLVYLFIYLIMYCFRNYNWNGNFVSTAKLSSKNELHTRA
jgi:hypothetical protein